MKLEIETVQLIHEPDLNKIETNSIIVTDKLLKNPDFQIIRVHRLESPIQLKRKIITSLRSSNHKKLVFGIDPGLSIGIALLDGEDILETSIVLSIRASIQWIKERLSVLRGSDPILRVGDGHKEMIDQFLEAYYRELGQRMRIEIVDESYSSIKSTNKITIHEQAAVIIAKREGELYRGRI